MISDYNAGGIADLFASADKAEEAWDPDPRNPQELWFRGQSKKAFNLLPGLYRNDNIAFNYDEEDLFERFKARSALFAPPRVDTDWDWYFLCQHHGLPTRLLDWTENLLVATYFAIAECVLPQGKQAYDDALSRPAQPPIYDADSPVVWILDAGTLNIHSVAPDADYVMSLGGNLTNKYLPHSVASIETDNRMAAGNISASGESANCSSTGGLYNSRA